jgi:hypothetical protein
VSAEAQSWAQAQQVGSSGAKLVLLVLANIADASGVGYPGRALLAQRCECRAATITGHLQRLESAGFIMRFERRRKNGSRTSDWVVLGPRDFDRALMVDASPEEYPAQVAEAASCAVSVPPLAGSGAVSAPGQVRFSGGPEQEGEQSGSSLLEEGKDRAVEHPEFSEWIGNHSSVTGIPVLKAGSSGRRKIAAMFGARRGDGLSLEDLKAATLGAFHDPFRREHGYFDAESVLRPTKVGKLVMLGRRVEQAPAPSVDEVDWSRFDA